MMLANQKGDSQRNNERVRTRLSDDADEPDNRLGRTRPSEEDVGPISRIQSIILDFECRSTLA